MKSIGIVIPAYNEKENILKLINGIRKYLDCIIIIVDDSNNNDTQKILIKNKIKDVKYFNRGEKSGRGSAVLFGFKKFLRYVLYILSAIYKLTSWALSGGNIKITFL